MRPNELRNFFKKYSDALKNGYNITELNVNDWRYANNTYFLGDGWALYSLTFEDDYVSLNNEDGGTITTFEWSDKLNKLMNFIHDNNKELHKKFPDFTTDIDDWDLCEHETWATYNRPEIIQFCSNKTVAIMFYTFPDEFPQFITTINWSEDE